LIENETEVQVQQSADKDHSEGTVRKAYYEPISYLYDQTVENAQVLAEYASPNSATSKNAYDYGAEGRTSSDQAGVYVYDGRGSVSETVTGSKVTNTLRYDPYGNITTGAPIQDQVYAYNGEQYTPQTGLIYLRARNYDPSTGTFTSKDTYMGDKTDPVTRNRYTYGNNNPVAYQDPSGHKGIFSKITSAVKSAAKSVAKTVSKPVVAAAKAVSHAAKSVAKAASTAVKTVARTASAVAHKAVSVAKTAAKTVVNTARTVYNTAKTAVARATTAVVNKVAGVAKAVVNTVKNVGQAVYNGAVHVYNTAKEVYQEAKETVVNYVDKAKTAVATFASNTWENAKDLAEEGLRFAIEAKQSVAQTVQEVGQWWSETSFSKNLTKAAESVSAAWHNSAIGKTVTAIGQAIDKAGTALKEKFENSSVGQFCSKVANSVSTFYEKHKTAINIIIGVAVIALCAVATVATAGTCGLAFAMASGALKGALIGAATGAVGGGLKSAMDYMEEHDTLDGSGSQILSGAAEGFRDGAISGAISGAQAGAAKYAKNPSGYCFVAGTLVLTTIGLVAIENIQPGDMVYAKEAVGVEQSVDVSQDSETAPVLEVFSHEVDETYVVTVDGEDIETTSNHPFYDENGEQVEAKDLEEGDELTTEDGDTATVDSVECIHHDEPVMVYNFCVMEDHTYFVGEHGVLVHNDCDGSAKNDFEKWLSKGASDNKVYHGVDAAGNSRYTGITKQSKAARLAQHQKNGKPFVDLEIQYDGLTRNQARAIEQYFIENGPNELNKINSISTKNKNYSQAMEWAKNFIGGNN